MNQAAITLSGVARVFPWVVAFKDLQGSCYA